MALVAQSIHRLPESLMVVDRQLIVAGQMFERLALPNRCVAFDIVADFRGEHEEAAIDPAAFADRLLTKTDDARAIRFERPEPAGRLRRSDSGEPTLALVEREEGLQI